jgi:hypothetical protein
MYQSPADFSVCVRLKGTNEAKRCISFFFNFQFEHAAAFASLVAHLYLTECNILKHL